MGVFKDIYCAECQQKTKLFSRTKLNDGTYVCSECTKHVPSYMMESLCSYYDSEDFEAFLRYANYSASVLRPLFHETHKYYSLHIDSEHKIFYIGNGINEETLFLQFSQLEDFDLVFHADEFKEGMVGDKVYGRILLKIKMGYPYFYYEAKLDEHVKVKAKKAFFGTNVEYENPKGMDEFLMYFVETWESGLEYSEVDDEYEDGELDDFESNELNQAMALFMIDDLSVVTLNDLKEQRNRLIKTFHPDKTTCGNTQYAQKINNAYDVLKQHIE